MHSFPVFSICPPPTVAPLVLSQVVIIDHWGPSLAFKEGGQEVTGLTIEHLQDLWLIDFLWLSLKNWFMENECIIKPGTGEGSGLKITRWGDRRGNKVARGTCHTVACIRGKWVWSIYPEYTCRADRAGYYRRTWAGVVESRKMYDYSQSVELISSERILVLLFAWLYFFRTLYCSITLLNCSKISY